jgi:hypothetical protein
MGLEIRQKVVNIRAIGLHTPGVRHVKQQGSRKSGSGIRLFVRG